MARPPWARNSARIRFQLPESKLFSIFVLLEKDWLRSFVFRLLKVAQTNANEPITLLRTEINPLSQLQGDVSQFFTGGG